MALGAGSALPGHPSPLPEQDAWPENRVRAWRQAGQLTAHLTFTSIRQQLLIHPSEIIKHHYPYWQVETVRQSG